MRPGRPTPGSSRSGGPITGSCSSGWGPARIAVISDFGSDLADILVQVGLRERIDVLAISAVEGLAKPAAAFFRLACERAAIDPEDAVMIGDTYRADIVGARSAGMDAILLDRTGKARETDVPVARTLVEAVELAAATHGTEGANGR